jgi:hypothetical protein
MKSTFVVAVIILSLIALGGFSMAALILLAEAVGLWWYTLSATIAGILWMALLATIGSEVVVRYVEKA